MAGKFPFTIAKQITVNANSSASAIFSVSSGETFYVRRLVGDNVIVNLRVLGIRDNRGRAYVLANSTDFIDGRLVPNFTQNFFWSPFVFDDQPLVVEAFGQLIVDLYNNSGSGITTGLYLQGVKEVVALGGVT